MNVSLKVSLRIIALFTVAIFVSKIPDIYADFFGDWKCEGSIGPISTGSWQYKGCNYGEGFHDSTWHWGYQHYLFFLMGLSLSIVQIADIVNILNNKNK